MLIIYSTLALGGIETFFVRLCEQRFSEGKSTNVLLLFPRGRCEESLILRLEQAANVYYLSDLIYFYNILYSRFPLIACFKRDKVFECFLGISQIHVTSGMHALLANKLNRLTQKKIPITVGVYHSKEFSWTDKKQIPYYEKINRRFVLDALPKKNLFFFSTDTRNYYGKDFTDSQTFRLGVINKVTTKKQYIKQKSLRICSVGRLVEFKQYNLWMIDVVNDLRNLGMDITYDIYGTGPLEEKMRDKINNYQLNDIVCLKGNLEYNYFDKIVSAYDLFIGSGTAIIQASALGVISIIGIESEKKALTYGLFSDFYQYEYHRDNLDLDKKSVLELINYIFLLSANEKDLIAKEHIRASKSFGMSECSQFFDNQYIAMEFNIIQYSLVKYIISDFCFWLKRKLKSINIYN